MKFTHPSIHSTSSRTGKVFNIVQLIRLEIWHSIYIFNAFLSAKVCKRIDCTHRHWSNVRACYEKCCVRKQFRIRLKRNNTFLTYFTHDSSNKVRACMRPLYWNEWNDVIRSKTSNVMARFRRLRARVQSCAVALMYKMYTSTDMKYRPAQCVLDVPSSSSQQRVVQYIMCRPTCMMQYGHRACSA
jgi:hypothetical protein